MAQEVEPYADVKDAADRLTRERLAKAADEGKVDLEIKPVLQAVTPNDDEAKKANTGGVEVKGSPKATDLPTSDGFSDPSSANPEKDAKAAK